MTENVTTAGIVDELNQFRGRVVLPDQPDYDDRRKGFYGGVDRRPAAILRAEDADDVALAISIARDRGLELAIRSGGHSVASHSTTEGGILLDLGDMQAIDVDRKNRTAWAQPGLTAGAYSLATAEHGLATGFGDTGTVGIGGITLGGGVGYLSRKLGLTIDSLLAADIVTADGQLRRADAATHPELFWAIRGGGGNFGVVTRFQFRLHEIGSVYGGLLAFAATAEALAALVSAAE